MRTTLNIDDDVLESVKRYSSARAVSLGRAASDLLRRGLATPVPTRIENGLVVFDLPEGTPTVTTEQVREFEAEW